MLEFAGQLGPWTGLALALVFAVITWIVYRRESRRSARFGRLLPLLRVTVVILIIFMLTGPTLRHRRYQGEPSRIIIMLDSSQSMAMSDNFMEPWRKVLVARSRGWLPDSAIQTDLHDTAQRLGDLRLMIEQAIDGRDKLDVAALAAAFHKELAQVHSHLGELNLTALPPGDRTGSGTILREYWLDLPGETVSDFTGHPRFVQPPTGSHAAATFEAPANLGDHYATRFRGYVLPPIDGNYTFFLASDGPGELWLSTSEDVSAKRRIARVVSPVKRWEWKSGEARSEPIALKGGSRYYIEALHKESTGDDHLAVGWQLPIGALERPIPGRRLAPFAALRGVTPQEQRDSLVEGFRAEILAPLDELIARAGNDAPAQAQQLTDLGAIASVVGRWEATLNALFETQAHLLLESADSDITAAIAKVDQMTRWERAVSSILSDGGIARALEEKHLVDIHAAVQGKTQLLWSSTQGSRVPDALAAEPDDASTDLTAGLHDRITPMKSAAARGSATDGGTHPRTSVILLSDGQHNVDAVDPSALAAVLGERGIPLYTIGFGSLTRPEDLSVRSVEGPQSVFHEDRIQGEVVIDDDMPPGKPFVLRLSLGSRVIWSRNLVTERGGIRRLPFDFPVKDLITASASAKSRDVTVLSIPLAFTATVTAVEGESEAGNNSAQMTVQAVTQPRRMLIIDGRPRWEARYLRNLFTRDQRWQVNTLLTGTSLAVTTWRRGEENGAFPPDLQSLYKYDVILFGDVPPGMLTSEELERIRDFVGERGGGIIFIDGQRGHLRSYAGSPIAELIPIEWLPPAPDDEPAPTRLTLTSAGQAATPLRITPEPLDNASLWQELRPPHWVASTRALHGAQVLAQAVIAQQTRPVIVQRNYGAGNVIYMGTDETWRWRYEVGDSYHARYWNQITRHIAEQPYTVQDQFVKLDAGGASYQPGDKALIRARLRDREGKPMLSANVAAQLYRDGRKVASLPLEPADNRSGTFRGQTAALEPGEYEVGLSVQGISDGDIKARASFRVEAPLSVERRAVVMNEQLLQTLAHRSNGRYYREEDLPQLIKRLEPASSGKIIVTETALWRSYWWFVPIMLLLTMEWLLRKRAGLL